MGIGLVCDGVRMAKDWSGEEHVYHCIATLLFLQRLYKLVFRISEFRKMPNHYDQKAKVPAKEYGIVIDGLGKGRDRNLAGLARLLAGDEA